MTLIWQQMATVGIILALVLKQLIRVYYQILILTTLATNVIIKAVVTPVRFEGLPERGWPTEGVYTLGLS